MAVVLELKAEVISCGLAATVATKQSGCEWRLYPKEHAESRVPSAIRKRNDGNHVDRTANYQDASARSEAVAEAALQATRVIPMGRAPDYRSRIASDHIRRWTEGTIGQADCDTSVPLHRGD